MPLTQATNLNSRLGFAVCRPNQVSNPNTFGGSSAAGRFDTAAFTAAAQFAIRTSSRNPIPPRSVPEADPDAR
jgi:hypothetical protein